ncbi:Response regulator receiver domain-containing protein [Desulfocicer vacuolatum DSM 3385]|uniref:Response regulator receiver domain-containing protein n=1 Tax=Desulfocicer vacuolatum DSM 3385 TaxID=1121400 RepID=A0A1W2AJS7_9BACT|nr:response regulator [Desulfocicer vacuolatum]SMC60820.1 Response regulator receiver domain-containing protein [Desulfocicer vacuolatum DSM 3385]
MDQKLTKILVVDQEADIRGFLQTVLTNRQFEVTLAVDEQEGIDKFQALEPDMLILDAMLPHQGMQTLLTHAKKTPILFISAIPLKVLFFRHKLQLGTGLYISPAEIPFLEKPLQEDELIEQINQLMLRIDSEIT